MQLISTPGRVVFPLKTRRDVSPWRNAQRVTRCSLEVNMIDAESPPFDASERVLEISTAQLDSRVKVVQMAGGSSEIQWDINGIL